MIRLSIAIPSIPSRREKAWALQDKLEAQINSRLTHPLEVAIDMYTDNKRKSIGKKRESAIAITDGQYVALLDDDDDISDEYIYLLYQACVECERIYNETGKWPDVISFKSMVTDKFGSYIVDMDLNHKENEQPHKDECDRYVDIKRPPWHVCAWRADLAKSVSFPDVGYGEDWHWVKQLIDKSSTQYKIDAVIHYYYDNPEVSEAPKESNEIWTNPNEQQEYTND